MTNQATTESTKTKTASADPAPPPPDAEPRGIANQIGSDAVDAHTRAAATTVDAIPESTEVGATSGSSGRKSTKKPKEKKQPAISAALKKALPANEQVRIRKRLDGKLWLVGDYSLHDIVDSGDVEGFIRRYIVPKWEYGEYHTFVLKDGVEKPYGQVPVLGPSVDAAPPSATESVRDLYDTFQKMTQQARSADGSILDNLAKFQSLTGSKGKKGGRGNGDLSPMMMMMMMQQNQQRPTSDPLIEACIRRMESMERSFTDAQKNAGAAPPPSPPAPPDPMATLTPLLTSFMDSQAKMLAALKPEPRNQLEEIATIANLVKPGPDPNAITNKDFFGIMKDMKGLLGGNEDDALVKAIGHLRMMQELVGGQQAGPIEQIAHAVMSRFLGQKSADVADAVDQSEQQQQQQSEEGVAIPESFMPLADKINAAQGAGPRAGAVLQGLQHLMSFAAFQPYIVEILTLAEKNEKQQCLVKLAQFMSGLVQAGVITAEAAQHTVEIFRQHWHAICGKLGFKHPPDPQITATATAQAPANGAPAPPAAAVGAPATPSTPVPDVESENDDGEVELPPDYQPPPPQDPKGERAEPTPEPESAVALSESTDTQEPDEQEPPSADDTQPTAVESAPEASE